MYEIYSRSTNRPEPIQGATIKQAQQNYVEYRRRISGTSFDWKYYEQRGYIVREKLSKISETAQNTTNLV